MITLGIKLNILIIMKVRTYVACNTINITFTLSKVCVKMRCAHLVVSKNENSASVQQVLSGCSGSAGAQRVLSRCLEGAQWVLRGYSAGAQWVLGKCSVGAPAGVQ